MTPGCPTPAELLEFALGNLPQPAFDRVAGHVSRCESCAAALEGFDALTDPLIQRLREPASCATLSGPVAPHLLGAALAAREAPAASFPRRLGKFELLE